MTGLDAASSNAIVKFANLLKNVKTAGITTLLDFSVFNVIRDVAMSGVQRTDLGRAAREGALGALTGGVTGAVTADSEESAVKRFMTGAGLGVGVGLYARPFAQTLSAVKQIVGNDQIYRSFWLTADPPKGLLSAMPMMRQRS